MLVTERKPPIIILATFTLSDPVHSAVLIFLHGLGDDATGLEGLSLLLYLFSKFPTFHPRIILKPFGHRKTISVNQETSIYEMDLSQCTRAPQCYATAWYTPTPLSPFLSSCPEPNSPEDEDGMKFGVAYVVTLIDDLVSQGIPEIRIVLGEFS